MVIQHCIEAMNASGQLNKTTKTLQQSTQKLSSGYRINKAADDAAGLSISEKMRRQIRGLSRASENAEDGISLVQIADGAMSEIQQMLDRGVELSVQAANGTMSDSDRAAVQNEIDQLKTEIDSIQNRTKFNEIYVLKGTSFYTQRKTVNTEVRQEGGLPSWVTGGGALAAGYLSETYQTTETYTIKVGTTQADGTITYDPPVSGQSYTVNHPAASLDFSNFNSEQALNELIGQGFHTTCCTCNKYYSIVFTADSTSSMETMTGEAYLYKIGIGDINMSQTSPISAAEELINRIIAGTSNGNPRAHFTTLEKDANSPTTLWVYDNRSKDATPFSTTDKLTWDTWKNHTFGINSRSGTIGAGYKKEYSIYADDKYKENGKTIALQVGADTGNFMICKLPSISSRAIGIDALDVRREGGPEEAITAFGEAKDFVSAERSRLGAYQNRLEHTISNLDNVVENTTDAESRIRDTDMAEEMVRYSNANILAQTGQAMLSQANQMRQNDIRYLLE